MRSKFKIGSTDREIRIAGGPGGRKALGANPRALGINARALGTNPKALGLNPRRLRELADLVRAGQPVELSDHQRRALARLGVLAGGPGQ